jgi:HSP20 family protein
MEEKKMKKDEKEMMKLTRKMPETMNPFGFMRRFTQDMQRLFEDFDGFGFPRYFDKDFDPFRTEFDNVQWVPPIEVLQNNGTLLVRAELPGMTKKDVKVEVTNDMLTISGERKEEKEEKHEGFYRSERHYGTFYRQVPLPEGVKIETANATFNNGVLEVTLPVPKMESHVRKLEITEPAPTKALHASA